MAFVRSPDNITVELLQTGEALPPQEPWASMANTGEWRRVGAEHPSGMARHRHGRRCLRRTRNENDFRAAGTFSRERILARLLQCVHVDADGNGA